MKKIKWIIDKDLFPEYEDKLVKSIENSGHDVYLVEYENDINWLKEHLKSKINSSDVVVFHGSIQFGRKFNKLPYYPAIYLTLDNYECYNYYGYYGDELLNSDYLMMGLSDVLRNKEKIFNYFNENNKLNKIFIRPSNGFKTFTGQCLSISKFDDDFNTLIKSYGGLDINTLVLLSNSKEIKKEYRFIIVGGEIISGALYMDENNKGTYEPYYDKISTNKNVFDYVKTVKDLYVPDNTFNIDICELENGEFKVIEINSFTCGTLYGNDTDKIVKAVNKLVVEDYYDVYSEI